MLIGLIEKLEEALDRYQSKNSGEEWANVMNALAYSIAAGDYWQVPVDGIEDSTSETDYEDGCVLERIPVFIKKTIGTAKQEKLLCAFTSPDKVLAGGLDKPVLSLRYPAKDLIQEFLKSETADGFLVNPWSSSFILTRSDAKEILKIAAGISKQQVLAMQSYRIEPKAVIDTHEILDSWRDGWEGDIDTQEKWELMCYPIMADGRILLLFEMRDELYAGKCGFMEVAHTFSHYRVLEYQFIDGKLSQIGKYRFKAQDAHIGTVFLYDGILTVSLCPLNDENYSILPVLPENDDGQFSIYSQIERTVTNSKGDVIVAYNSNLLDDAHLPIMVFDRGGDCIASYYSEHTLLCRDVNIDRDENIWFHMYPSATIDMLENKSNTVKSYGVDLPGFDSFALSDDKTKLFVSFSEYNGGSLQYILSRDEEGNYRNPIPFAFLPVAQDGGILEAKDCEIFGACSSMKAWVILNADGHLYLYDINDCCS